MHVTVCCWFLISFVVGGGGEQCGHDFTALEGLQMALAFRLDAISQGPKKSCFQGPTPQTCPRNGCCPHQKHYARGAV
jgi:hypothetical protein